MVIRTDNGKKFCGRAMLTWAHERGITLRLIEPGKPNQNAYVEWFNGRLRDECLNEHWFTSLAHARDAIEAWRREYNEETTEETARRTDACRVRKPIGQQRHYSTTRALNPTVTQEGVRSQFSWLDTCVAQESNLRVRRDSSGGWLPLVSDGNRRRPSRRELAR